MIKHLRSALLHQLVEYMLQVQLVFTQCLAFSFTELDQSARHSVHEFLLDVDVANLFQLAQVGGQVATCQNCLIGQKRKPEYPITFWQANALKNGGFWFWDQFLR